MCIVAKMTRAGNPNKTHSHISRDNDMMGGGFIRIVASGIIHLFARSVTQFSYKSYKLDIAETSGFQFWGKYRIERILFYFRFLLFALFTATDDRHFLIAATTYMTNSYLQYYTIY